MSWALLEKTSCEIVTIEVGVSLNPVDLLWAMRIIDEYGDDAEGDIPSGLRRAVDSGPQAHSNYCSFWFESKNV